MRLAAARALSTLRQAMTTRAPRRLNSPAVGSPMPRLAPVTMATRPD